MWSGVIVILFIIVSHSASIIPRTLGAKKVDKLDKEVWKEGRERREKWRRKEWKEIKGRREEKEGGKKEGEEGGEKKEGRDSFANRNYRDSSDVWNGAGKKIQSKTF